jgi:hypothetical protein
VKTSLSVLTALLLASTMHIQSTHAEPQRQPSPEFFVALGLGTPPPPASGSEERLEDRLRERFYGSGSEEWREERVREERRERGHCYRLANPTEREGCFDDLEADPK